LRTLMLASAVTVFAALATGGGVAHANGGAKYDFRVSPSVGTTTTTFRVTFSAPFRANGDDTEYTLEAVGPRRCASVFEISGSVRRGDRVVMRLTPSDDILIPDRIHRRWCRGAYVGYVYYTSADLDFRLIGYFSFGVGRSPVSLEG
jgi:hypothetical protein